MALGETLRKARMARRETTSQVASATRMKVQVVEGLEKEDFSQIPAPIYGKGFIKLYAEHVGLDAEPLIREYMGLRGNPAASPLASSPPKNSRRKDARKTKPDTPASDLFQRAGIPLPGDGDQVDVVPAPHEPVQPSDAWREPGKRVLNSDLEHYQRTGSGETVNMETEDPPITMVQQILEKALLALQHGMEKFIAAKTRMQESFKGITVQDLWQAPGKFVTAAAALIVILILLLSGLSRTIKSQQDTRATSATDPVLILFEDPPEPYFD